MMSEHPILLSPDLITSKFNIQAETWTLLVGTQLTLASTDILQLYDFKCKRMLADIPNVNSPSSYIRSLLPLVSSESRFNSKFSSPLNARQACLLFHCTKALITLVICTLFNLILTVPELSTKASLLPWR